MKKQLNLKVHKESTDQRIDKYLAEQLKREFSRSDIKKLIQQHNVLLNSREVRPNQKVKENDEILVISAEEKSELKIPAVDIGLDIIFEDEFLLVVNKPAGMVVHPAAGHFDDTLVNALLFHCQSLSDVNGLAKPGIVHRLDKDTSGILVVAKDNKTHRNLAKQFKTHAVKKTYIAIVNGAVEYDEGIIDQPLSRSPFDRKKMKVQHGASREAITRYRVLSRNDDISIVEVYPETGRTHQIRVHLAYLGHPIIGDDQYGKNQCRYAITRQALHAKSLGFTHPDSGNFVEFTAKIPPDMQEIIDIKMQPE